MKFLHYILLIFVLSPLTMVAQTARPRWSIFVGSGCGLQDIVPLTNLDIPVEARPYLNKRGIYSLNVPTQTCSPWSPAANIGASYNINARWRLTLHAGNQNIMQQNYHAMVFSADALAGYDLIRHPHHACYVETGVGGYFSWNEMNYLWRGKDGDGNQIVIDGVPEEIFVDLGHHNTRNISLPVKFSYQYNLQGSHWLGAFVQGRVNPLHETFAPLRTVSAGVEYRYTFGFRKKKVERKRPLPPALQMSSHVCHKDTIFIDRIVERVVNDTIYVQQKEDDPTPPQSKTERWVFFEIDQHELPPYEQELLTTCDFSDAKSVIITAFTCGLGSEEHNLRLAHQRLSTVARLLKARGINIEQEDIVMSPNVSPRYRAVKIEFIK